MRRLILLGLISATIAFAPSAQAGETAFNRISSTLNGGSGLFITQAINTLAPGKLELGLGGSYEQGEDQTRGDFTIPKLSQTITVGLTRNMEVSVHTPYFVDLEIENSSESALGDVSLSLKWRFMEASTQLNFPGFAFHLTAFLPTGGERAEGTAQVASWGAQLLLVSSAETEVGFPDMSLLIGFYADGGVYVQDSGDVTEERSGVIDLGLLIPLNGRRTLQLMLEANARVKREFLLESEHEGLTGGFRYVTRHISLNLAWQHKSNQDPLEDSERLIFYGSYFF